MSLLSQQSENRIMKHSKKQTNQRNHVDFSVVPVDVNPEDARAAKEAYMKLTSDGDVKTYIVMIPVLYTAYL